MHAGKKPSLLHCILDKRGLRIDNMLYPYQSLQSFWITDDEENAKLIIESNKSLMPYIILPLPQGGTDRVRDFLLDVVDEEEHYEPLSHRVMDYLGF